MNLDLEHFRSTHLFSAPMLHKTPQTHAVSVGAAINRGSTLSCRSHIMLKCGEGGKNQTAHYAY